MKHDRHVPPARGAVGSVVTLDTADGAYMVEPLTLAPTRGAMPMRWLSELTIPRVASWRVQNYNTNFTHGRTQRNDRESRTAQSNERRPKQSSAEYNTQHPIHKYSSACAEQDVLGSIYIQLLRWRTLPQGPSAERVGSPRERSTRASSSCSAFVADCSPRARAGVACHRDAPTPAHLRPPR